jgi:hypothetical protein
VKVRRGVDQFRVRGVGRGKSLPQDKSWPGEVVSVIDARDEPLAKATERPLRNPSREAA